MDEVAFSGDCDGSGDWGGKKFREFCVALVRDVISHRVIPGPKKGPDGGRDAVLSGRGKGDWKDWDGEWIFQFKYRDPLDRAQARRGLLQAFEKELDRIRDLKFNNYIFITNTSLSWARKNGTYDQLDSIVREKLPGIKFEIWGFEKLETLLDSRSDDLIWLRKRYFPTPEELAGSPNIVNVFQNNFYTTPSSSPEPSRSEDPVAESQSSTKNHLQTTLAKTPEIILDGAKLSLIFNRNSIPFSAVLPWLNCNDSDAPDRIHKSIESYIRTNSNLGIKIATNVDDCPLLSFDGVSATEQLLANSLIENQVSIPDVIDSTGETGMFGVLEKYFLSQPKSQDFILTRLAAGQENALKVARLYELCENKSPEIDTAIIRNLFPSSHSWIDEAACDVLVRMCPFLSLSLESQERVLNHFASKEVDPSGSQDLCSRMIERLKSAIDVDIFFSKDIVSILSSNHNDRTSFRGTFWLAGGLSIQFESAEKLNLFVVAYSEYLEYCSSCDKELFEATISLLLANEDLPDQSLLLLLFPYLHREDLSFSAELLDIIESPKLEAAPVLQISYLNRLLNRSHGTDADAETLNSAFDSLSLKRKQIISAYLENLAKYDKALEPYIERASSSETRKFSEIELYRHRLKPYERISFAKDLDVVMTYRAQDPEGEDFFAYVVCDRKGTELMRYDFKKQNSRKISDYGKMIFAAYIKDPDEEAREFLKGYIQDNGGELT